MEEAAINIAEIIADKIKVRYAEITERTMGSANMVVDSFYPTYVRESLIMGTRKHTLGQKCSAISPFIANELGVFQTPFEDIIKMLGYKKADLKKMLETVKAKKIDLVLVGLGGTGMNFMHWATEVCNYTNTVALFDRIKIYDKDMIDLTNIFRFPQILNPSGSYSQGAYRNSVEKINCLPANTILCRKPIDTSYEFLNVRSLSFYVERSTAVLNTAENYNDNEKLLSENKRSMFSSLKNKVYYGAPDIESREAFYGIEDIKFISGTHGDDSCQLYIKPPQNSSIQIESYGMINLSVFFMNQVKLTLSFLELLASNTDLTQEKLVLDYSFSEQYISGSINKAGLNRTYNFPILKNNLIDQEVGLPDVVEEINTEDIQLVEEETTEKYIPSDMYQQTIDDAYMDELAYKNIMQLSEPDSIIPICTTVTELVSTVSELPEPQEVVATTVRTRARRRTSAEMALARGEVETIILPTVLDINNFLTTENVSNFIESTQTHNTDISNQ